MAQVCVLPQQAITGWDGDLSKTTETYPVMDLRAALEKTYDNDAHFTMGVAVGYKDQPRFVKYRKTGGQSTAAVYAELGVDIRFTAIALDVDRPPEEEPEAWWAINRTLWELSPAWATAGWYLTRGGYRLVWELPQELGPDDYERVQRRLFAEASRVGIKADKLTDWTRIFRLPFVRRDGVVQRFDYDFSKLGVLPVDEMRTPEGLDKIAVARAGDEAAWALDFEAGRNKALFKLAVMTIKGLPDLPDEYLEIFIKGIHEAKCPEPMDDSEVTRIIQNARRYRPDPTVLPDVALTSDASYTFGDRKQILVSSGELVRAMDETLDVMADNKGVVYSMGGGLMRLKRDIEGFLVFEEIPKPALRTIVERLVEYCKASRTGLSAIDVPKDLIEMLAVLPDYGDQVWKLQEILTTPTLAPDGTPVLTKGYHENLELYLDCPADLDGLDLTGDPQDAFNKVKHLLVDVPFERPEHASVAMCSFITPVVRTAIEGPVPIVLFDSTTRGSGKGLLADLTSLLATGRKATIQPYVDETEFEKRVTALLQMGLRTIVIDNIDRPFGGATLDALLTADMWTGRVLGQTKMIKFRSRAHWMATGNNIQIKGDLDRRALRCYLAPNIERPEERATEDYVYQDIKGHVVKNRKSYVEAILTFMKAYIDKGCPRSQGLKPLGSFENWSRLVRGAVIHYGMVDPVTSQEALRSDGAPALWGQTVNSLLEIFPNGEFTARDVYDAAFRGSTGSASRMAYQTLESAMEELIGGKATVRSVAFVLKRWLNRVIGGKKLVKAESKDRLKGHVYTIESL